MKNVTKIVELFKVRRMIKELLTQSGTHNNDPMCFCDVAIKRAKAKGVGKFECYYFFKHCEAQPDMDSVFQPFLNDNLKGDTLTNGSSDDDESKPAVSSRSKKRILEHLQKSAISVDQLLEFMKSSQARAAKKEDLDFLIAVMSMLA